ncbi:MAG: DUF4976 domain-containing protein, partial [Planctomycetes bacterium]|nr:DUF4976 domain-containing protein [Planctomycetota bacterium]
RGAQCTNNAPLRSGKGSLYEGGIRIPLIVSWPDVTSPESETDSPVILTDLFHTLTAALSLPNPAQSYGDGVDLTALLKGQSKTVERSSLYFHYPHYYHIPATTPVSAVIEQDWKLIEFFEDGHHELFNLTEDPYEQNDISSKHQQKVTELSSRLKKWRSDVQAALPTSNSKGQ